MTAALLMSAGQSIAAERDAISIVGSSTVYPFATVVGDEFRKRTQFPAPVIESTGTGGGIKLFCAGVGVKTPDISNASVRMSEGQFQGCLDNGVTDVVEVQLGYDGLVFAQSREARFDLSLTTQDVYHALAAELPDGQGGYTPNPHRTWASVNPALPAEPIVVLGPPPTSGTRAALAELVLQAGAVQHPAMAALKKRDKKEFVRKASLIREDGVYIEAGENDNLIVQKLVASPAHVGVFGFNALDQNSDRLLGLPVNGVTPSFDAVLDQSYPVVRPLFIYVKKAHIGVIPGVHEFVRLFVSESAFGEEGFLIDRGLVPLLPELRAQMRTRVETLEPLSLSSFSSSSTSTSSSSSSSSYSY